MKRYKRIALAGIACAALAYLCLFLWPNDRKRMAGRWVSDTVILEIEGDVMKMTMTKSGDLSELYFTLQRAEPVNRITWGLTRYARVPYFFGIRLGQARFDNPQFVGHGVYEFKGDLLRLGMHSSGGGPVVTSFEDEIINILEFRRQ